MFIVHSPCAKCRLSGLIHLLSVEIYDTSTVLSPILQVRKSRYGEVRTAKDDRGGEGARGAISSEEAGAIVQGATAWRVSESSPGKEWGEAREVCTQRVRGPQV